MHTASPTSLRSKRAAGEPPSAVTPCSAVAAPLSLVVQGGGVSVPNGSAALVAVVGLALAAVVAVAVLRRRRRSPPTVSRGEADVSAPGSETDETPASPEGERSTPTRWGSGRTYEAEVRERATRSVEPDSFAPVGTALLLAAYFAVLAGMWLFMYFVEFLGNGPRVVG